MSYANKVLGSIPFGVLIGAPLTAAVQAQADAARASIDFIRSVGFNSKSEDNEFGDVVVVKFNYTVRNNDGGTREMNLSVPLLTIVPIPYLRIDDMTIDFTSKITEEITRTTSRDGSVETDSSLNIDYDNFLSPVKVGFQGSVSTKHSSSSATSNRYNTEHTININVRAVQDDIPAGMSRVLNILESGISEPVTPS